MIGVAVLGAGNRARGVVGQLLKDAPGHVQVVSIFDPDETVARQALTDWDASEGRICGGAEAAIRTEGVDWVMVFSPNAFHKEQIIDAFAAGKHVFSEKPLATSIEDCIAIQRAHEGSGLQFATGFVLRYAPIYRAIRDLLDSGTFGPIISIAASENIKPGHGGYIMMNWRRFTKIAGPHILEKCCHDVDLLNWYCGDLPRRVASFGGRSVFTPENQPLQEKYGRDAFCAWFDPHAEDSPFTSEKDLMDHQTAILEYRNGIQVAMQVTMSNAIPERRLYISCLKGTIISEIYSGTLSYKRMGDAKRTDQQFPGGGHGGGDEFIMKELFKTMTEGTPPLCGGDEGLLSAVVALALDQAAQEKQIIDLAPTWKALGR